MQNVNFVVSNERTALLCPLLLVTTLDKVHAGSAFGEPGYSSTGEGSRNPSNYGKTTTVLYLSGTIAVPPGLRPWPLVLLP